MPDRAQRPCMSPGCSGLTRSRYCSQHIDKERDERAAYERERAGREPSVYDMRWQYVRMTFLFGHPLCEQCQADGMSVSAVLVHHIVPIKDGGAVLDPSNLQALCQRHHEAIHGKDRWKRRKY
jgi:5-methylcytosine-specific restriction protein A